MTRVRFAPSPTGSLHVGNALSAVAKSRDAAGTREAAAAQDRHVVGKRHHLPELVGDHQDRQLVALDHIAQHAEHLVGFAGPSK